MLPSVLYFLRNSISWSISQVSYFFIFLQAHLFKCRIPAIAKERRPYERQNWNDLVEEEADQNPKKEANLSRGQRWLRGLAHLQREQTHEKTLFSVNPIIRKSPKSQPPKEKEKETRQKRR